MCESHKIEDQSKRLLAVPYIDIIRRTEKAILFSIQNNSRKDLTQKEWLPKSQITINEDRKFVTMPLWLAVSRGFAKNKTFNPVNPSHIEKWIRTHNDKIKKRLIQDRNAPEFYLNLDEK